MNSEAPGYYGGEAADYGVSRDGGGEIALEESAEAPPPARAEDGGQAAPQDRGPVRPPGQGGGRRGDEHGRQPRSQDSGRARAPPSILRTARPSPRSRSPDQVLDSRQIIYTASMHVSVFNLEESMQNLEGLPEKYGGYIHSMSEGHMVARIPAKNLREVMNDLGGLGVVESRSLQALDVTAEYTDVESRIRVLEETQTQMIELLSKARTVKEALEVRKALDGITMELEVLKGRMRQLKNQISFSTLTIQLTERGPHMPTPSSNDPFPWVDSLGVESTEWR